MPIPVREVFLSPDGVAPGLVIANDGGGSDVAPCYYVGPVSAQKAAELLAKPPQDRWIEVPEPNVANPPGSPAP